MFGFHPTPIILAAAQVLFLLLPAGVSAQTFTREPAIDYPGDDYRQFDAWNDAAVCEHACRREAQCQVYTYLRPNASHPRGICYLKTSARNRRNDPCCESGRKETQAAVGAPTSSAGANRCEIVELQRFLPLIALVVRNARVRLHTLGPRRIGRDREPTWYSNQSAFRIGGRSMPIEVPEYVRGVRDKKYYVNDFNSTSIELMGPSQPAPRRTMTNSILLRIQFETDGTEIEGRCADCLREDAGARDAQVVATGGANVPEIDVHIRPLAPSGLLEFVVDRIDLRLRVDRPGLEFINTKINERLAPILRTSVSGGLAETLRSFAQSVVVLLQSRGLRNGELRNDVEFEAAGLRVCGR